MTAVYIISGSVIVWPGWIYVKHFFPLRQWTEGFEYVYVEEDGTVRELDEDEKEYLQTEFHPNDGARPYIKSYYEQLTPDKKIWGFILRRRVPRHVQIKPVDHKDQERDDNTI